MSPPNDPPSGWAALPAIGNTLQSIAQAIIKAVVELQQLMPMFTSGQVAADTLIQTGFVRVTGLSVVTVGGSPGTLYDAATLADAASGNAIFAIPATTGYTNAQMIFAKGLVYKPGSGEAIAVFYVRS